MSSDLSKEEQQARPRTNSARQAGRDYFERVEGNVYTGTVIIQRNGREIQLPLQRPPRAEFFTDRNEELAHLLHDLQPGRVVTLCGSGGIGKTALAAEAIWRLADEEQLLVRFPDGLIFHSFYGRPDVNLALEHIAASYGADPRPTPELAALQVLAGKRALLFFDGTEEASDLRAVLNVRGECGVIVTSRSRKDAVAGRQDVTPLPTDDAVKLLRAWGKDQVLDETAVHQICDGVGGLPLAVRLVGRYLDETGEPAAEYLGWLQAQPLDALDQGEHREENVALLLHRSLAQVSEDARQILSLAGVLAFAPFSREVVAAAFKSPIEGGQGGVHSLRKPLNELVSYGLLLRSGVSYTVSHALIHTYARRRLAVATDAVTRLAVYYNAFAREQRELGLEGYSRLDAERPHIMRVLETCHAQEQWQAVSDLVFAVQDYLDIRGYWTEWQAALKMGVEAARQSGNRYYEGAFLSNLGLVYRDLGQVEKAIGYHEQALTIARDIGDRQGEGATLGNLGLAYRALGQVEQAITFYEQALAIHREIGDRQGEGGILGNLGSAYAFLGQVEQAITYHEQALAISREIGDRRGEGSILGNLGNAYYFLGQVEQAITYHEQALAISHEIGDRRGEGLDLGNLGSAYADLGQVEQAITYHEQALAISREIGDRQNEGIWLGNLGNAYRDLGQLEKAIRFAEQGLQIALAIKDPLSEGFRRKELGIIYKELGQIDTARQYFQESLAIFEAIKSPDADKVWRLLEELE